MGFYIKGTGMYVPPRVVTNDELSEFVETNDEWIRQRVGVEQRHISTNEWTSEMACKAARNALDNAGIQVSDLDLILSATVSAETVSPSVACMVQHDLGATCCAFEINAACSAFYFYWKRQQDFLLVEKFETCLVVGGRTVKRHFGLDRSQYFVILEMGPERPF